VSTGPGSHPNPGRPHPHYPSMRPFPTQGGGHPPPGGPPPPPGGYASQGPYLPPGAPVRRRASMYGGAGGRPPAGGRRLSGGERFRRYLPWISLLLVLMVSGVLGYVLWTIRDTPDPGQTPSLSRTVIVYDRKGRVIEQRNSDGQFSQTLHLSQMGDLNRWATLAAEDRSFYTRASAIDFAATARAAAADLLRQGNLQGGSTITQQLVKISVLTPQRSIFRKLQEATIATELESRYSKDQILEMYLNRVYYGHSAYGIGAAARVFFAKDAPQLTVAQAAFLAGLINGPTYYDPQTSYDLAKERQLYVLDGMVKTGHLTQVEADQAAQEDVKAALRFDQTVFKSRAPHFVNYVIGQAEKILAQSQDISRGSIKIYTTLDLDLQDLAQRSVTNGIGRAQLRNEGVNNGDLLAADPRTGEILAWVGSADYYNDSIAGQVDVPEYGRQPGSSFKPYVFEAALKDHRITLATTLQDKPTDFGNYKPHDFDDQFMGDISARRSLLLSRNVPAVQTASIVGMSEVIRQAHAQGIQSTLTPNLATSIGGSDVTMLDQVQGYQAFANQGRSVPLMTISKITTAGDDLLYQVQPGSQPGISQAMTAAESYLVTDVLKDYQRQWNLGWKRQMAGKSGTTGGDQTGVHRDAWMMAYNQDIVIGAWAGNTAPNTVNGGAGKNISAFGTEVGQLVLAPFINGLPSTISDWYRRPDGLTDGTGCPASGPQQPSTELFLSGTQGGINCPSPSPTPTPSATPSPTPTPSATPSARPTSTPTPSVSPSPIISPRVLPSGAAPALPSA
jgi:membrane peptidoglycan carboxypeptidase